MNRPPMLMRMRFYKGDRKFGIWLPLFLLMPLALVVLIILSPLILIAILVLWPSRWGRLARLVIPASWGLFYSIRGLQVDVQGRHEYVYISVV
jgi:hypothetical protein